MAPSDSVRTNPRQSGCAHRCGATVKTHVAGILSKLALRNRARVVVLAYESGMCEPGLERPPSDGPVRAQSPGAREPGSPGARSLASGTGRSVR